MKNNYDLIRSHLEYGHKVEVKTEDGRLFSFISYETDVDSIMDNQGCYWSKKEIEAEQFTSITPIPHRYKKLEVGTKVDVLEGYDKILAFKSPWKVTRADEYDVELQDYELNKIVPLWAITPHVEEEIPSERERLPNDFKECFECAPKPGSPYLCHQCLWTRENYPKRETPHVEGEEETKTVKSWPDDLSLEQQLQRLGKFLLENHACEIGKMGSEGAIECAVRLLTNYNQTKQQACKCIDVSMGSYKNTTTLITPTKRRLVGIDTCIVQEIAELWRAGVVTIESCCGHNKTKGYIAVEPESAPIMEKLGYKRLTDKDRNGEKFGSNDNFFYPKSVARQNLQGTNN